MQKFLKNYNICLSYIQHKQLVKALSEIDHLVDLIENWPTKQECLNIQRNYLLLLQYFKQGAKDPERQQQRRKTFQQSLTLLDTIRQFYTLIHGTSTYAQQLRSCKTRSFNLKSALDNITELQQKALLNAILATDEQKLKTQKEIEEAQIELFDQIWTSDPWIAMQSKTALTFLEDASNDVTTQKLMLSSLMMACMQLFDPEKLNVLIQTVLNRKKDLYIRALVGVVLIIIKQEKRLEFYPEVIAQLQKIKEVKNICKDLCTIQIQLFSIQHLPELEKKLSKDIFPDFVKKNNNTGTINIINIESIMDDDNPEELGNDDDLQKLKDHVKDIQEMHKQGIDLAYYSFKHMKGFPFFQQTCNWFLPFTEEHSSIRNFLQETGTFLSSFIKANKLCYSDQYSMGILMQQMSDMQRNMTYDSLKKQLGEEDLNNLEIPEETLRHTEKIRFYMQDCFRYFSVAPRQEEDMHPFKSNVYLFNNPYLAPFFNDKELLLQTAYYAHNYNMQLDVIHVMEYIDEHFNLDLEALQIYGSNLIKQKEYSKALLCFEKASLISTHSKWVLNNLGFCYLKTDNIQKAFLTYSQLIHLYPEEFKAVLRYGECLYRMGKYDKAINEFHKVEYYEPNHPKATQAIAYCSLLNLDALQADKYYDKLQDIKMSQMDYRNAAHAAWLTGNTQKALELYKKAKTDGEITLTTQEISLFNTYGIEMDDIQLLQDLIDSSL